MGQEGSCQLPSAAKFGAGCDLVFKFFVMWCLCYLDEMSGNTLALTAGCNDIGGC